MIRTIQPTVRGATTHEGSRHRLRSGFTLVEIMIVVSIIGVLASIAVPSFMKSRRSAQVRSSAAELRVVEQAYHSYELENNNLPGMGWPSSNFPPDLDGYLKIRDWSNGLPCGGCYSWGHGWGSMYGTRRALCIDGLSYDMAASIADTVIGANRQNSPFAETYVWASGHLCFFMEDWKK